jgi:hypothetical protein
MTREIIGGVNDARLEAFDWVLQDLDVHCRQRK